MDDALDSLLADLQSATRPGRMSTSLSSSHVRPSGVTSSSMSAAHSSYEYSRKYTETSTSSSRSIQTPSAPATVERKTDVSDLDNLLQQVKSPAVTSSVTASSHLRANGREESPVVDTRNTVAVSKLVADLEHDLNHPDSARKWKNVRGLEVKPITTTTFYEESNTTYEVRPTSLVPPPKPLVSPNKPIVRESVRDFENLSNLLSDVKIREPVSKPKPIKTTVPSVASELLPKGNCCVCKKPIYGQVVSALGKNWHLECFTCYHCGIELGRENFFEKDGKPYCENDYYNLFSPKCAYCTQPIIDKCVSALGKTWHPEHFNCCNCANQFGDEGYHEMDGKAYCRDCYYDLYAPKCAGCGNAITDNYISALDGQWHPDCFVCWECRCPFIGGSFFDFEGKPYCETHYHLKRGSLCAGCHKPIIGRCVTAMFRKFHPEHFVCAFCLQQLNKGTFKEQNDKPYCHPCFDKLFS